MDQITQPRIPRHQAILDRMIETGDDLVQMVHAQARALAEADPTAPLSTPIRDYERAARTVRRCMLLAEKFDRPARSHAPARRQIIRAVEDAIHRDAYDDDTLHAELLDRLDRPELAEELDEDRPAKDIITDILRDFGLAALPGTDPWCRRTPDDIATLHARAATPQTPTKIMPGPAPATHAVPPCTPFQIPPHPARPAPD